MPTSFIATRLFFLCKVNCFFRQWGGLRWFLFGSFYFVFSSIICGRLVTYSHVSNSRLGFAASRELLEVRGKRMASIFFLQCCATFHNQHNCLCFSEIRWRVVFIVINIHDSPIAKERNWRKVGLLSEILGSSHKKRTPPHGKKSASHEKKSAPHEEESTIFCRSKNL